MQIISLLQLEPGKQLPSPEKLKGKILIKDKVIRSKFSAQLQKETSSENGLEEDEEDEEEENEGGEVEDFQEYLATVNDPIAEEFIRATSISEHSRSKITTGRRQIATLTNNGEHLETNENAESTETQVVEENHSPQRDNKRVPDPSQLLKQGSGSSMGSEEEKKTDKPPDIDLYNDLLIYTTAIKFKGFDEAEEEDKRYVMSSFEEVKSFNLIKACPKQFVRYNQRQNSRIYPAGTRIASSNYMPQIYWNVGCQLVALNFQTMDVPLQLNVAKFEANGGTGYILKPWALCHDKDFSPFVLEKLANVVPIRLTVKVISGIFIPSKKPNLVVEAEMFGLPADTVRHQYSRKIPGPHPHWNEDPFVFKLLLPKMALLRVAVLDDDHTMVAHRFLPVSHLKTGFHHIPLRDKHNSPLGMASLFVHIKIRDYVPDQLEIFVQRMTNPTAFLDILAEGTVAERLKTSDEQQSLSPIRNKGLGIDLSKSAQGFCTLPRRASATPAVSPQGVSMIDSPGTSFSLQRRVNLVPNSPSFGSNTLGGAKQSLECIQEARERQVLRAAEYDSVLVLQNPEYKKLEQKYDKLIAETTKKNEKVKKSMLIRQSKEYAKLSKVAPDRCICLREQHEKDVDALEEAQELEIKEISSRAKKETLEKRKWLLDMVHRTQQKSLERLHQGDVKKFNFEVDKEMKRRRRAKDGQYLNNSDGMRYLIEEMVKVGKEYRAELSEVHRREMERFEESVKENKQKMEDYLKAELGSLDN